VRIVITSPPKAGNKWLKCLLSSIYGLTWMRGDSKPPTNPAAFEVWVQGQRFPDGIILHQHCRYTPRLCDAIEAIPAALVTIIRDPYDVFVSYYHWVQDRADHFPPMRAVGRPRDELVDKPLDDPEVIEFLTNRFGRDIERACGWKESGRAIVVRYEALHDDPSGELTRVTDAIEPVDPARIAAAMNSCSAENMRKLSEKMSRHVRKATVGDSTNQLGEAHLTIFRERYADLIRRLGYEVR
jgi:sulfotransferase family protein